MLPSDWQLLRAGEGTDVILAVDFPVTGPEPSLQDVAQLLDVPYGIWQPWGPDYEADLTVNAVLSAWSEHARDEGLAVRAVLGSCAGATFACAVAARLAGTGAKPPVILFDPDTVRGEMLHYQFMLAVAQFAELAQVPTAVLYDRASAVCRDNDIPGAAAVLADEHRKLGEPVLLELGVDAETSAEIFRRFSQYLAYLVAAWRIGYSASDDETVAILSERYAYPAGLRGRAFRFATPHAGLFTHAPAVSLASATVNNAWT